MLNKDKIINFGNTEERRCREKRPEKYCIDLCHSYWPCPALWEGPTNMAVRGEWGQWALDSNIT